VVVVGALVVVVGALVVVVGSSFLQIGFDDPGVQHFGSFELGPQDGSVGGGKYVVGGLVGGRVVVGALVVVTTGGFVVGTVFGGSVNVIKGVVYSYPVTSSFFVTIGVGAL
jgi:hypothetical protein